MSIQDESIVLDTNVGIFGLRRVPDSTACAEIDENLNRFRLSKLFIGRFSSLRESDNPD